MNRDRIDSLVESIFPQVLSHRLHLHAHPELSFQEYETMNYVSNALTELGIRHDKEVGGTGVVGYISSPNSSEWIGLRADLDALPISEQNDVPYRSKVPGVMHACGHDVHTSILLGTAAVLMQMRDELPVSVKLIFQPGEEVSPGGANYIIDAGIMDNPTLNAMVARVNDGIKR
jgi:amidohydrolase